ncbi:hypothetical protein TCAL_08309 [Tigriopus californicus]|uniref:YTH domain-containing protein n=1 Tax=Tigriopus californicus TaxID=6832 RepID=A0A553PC54_TIGCA|nr:hypothetical protein TCAL_08309 [Tigriopus californicus]|eukprot:TCALIF_08309-PA protein Name:"Similar to Ythdf2 YTH domain-containing family protein 2 (Mus musculus)" AED:0.25 eAED:0.25 QI:0/-1/0/1/-1/1/1/0/384
MHDPPRGGYADKSGSNSGPRNQRQYSNVNGSSGSSHEYRSGNGRSGHHGDFNSGEKKRTDRVADFGGGIAPSSGSHGSPPSLQATHHPILESLQSQNEYNPKTFDLNPKNAKFFVIKSFSEDDIHRSIKYEIWCSTDHGNKRLDAGFKERNGKGPVFLLFSVNGSGHFCGMAEMLSGVDYNATGSVWVQDKFKGQFKVKWIYVKDVPNGQLRHIRLENNENKPVTNSRDTQEVPPDKGKQVLKIIHTYKHQTSIFDDFIHYEKRQEDEEGKKSMSAAAPLSSHSAHNKDAGNGGNHHSLQHPSRGGSGGAAGGAGGARKDGQDTHQGGGPSAQGGGRGSRGGGERVGKFNNHHPNNHFNSNTKNTNNMGSKTPNTSGQGASNRR